MNKTPTLLHIDASPRGPRSQSRLLGREFVAAWREAHPAGRVLTRDVGHSPPPFVTESWVEGAFAPAADQSPAAKAAIAVSDQYVDELLAADQVVITTPIYNLSLPAALKAWIDQIVRMGRTVSRQPGGFEGLVQGRRVTVVVTSGSDFRPQSPGGAYNFLEPYLRAVLGFIGLTDVHFIYAHSQNQSPEAGAQALREAQAAVRQIIAA